MRQNFVCGRASRGSGALVAASVEWEALLASGGGDDGAAQGVTALAPESQDFENMYQQVKALKDGKAVQKPIYNHVSGKLDPAEEIKSPKVPPPPPPPRALRALHIPVFVLPDRQTLRRCMLQVFGTTITPSQPGSAAPKHLAGDAIRDHLHFRLLAVRRNDEK